MTEEPRRLKRPERPPALELRDDTVVTQYGRIIATGPEFRGGPTEVDGGGLSVIVGKVDFDTAALLVTQSLGTPGLDAVRHTTVEMLRRQGFLVEHDPDNWNGAHALVRLPKAVTKWDNATKKKFKAAFQWYQEGESDDRS